MNSRYILKSLLKWGLITGVLVVIVVSLTGSGGYLGDDNEVEEDEEDPDNVIILPDLDSSAKSRRKGSPLIVYDPSHNWSDPKKNADYNLRFWDLIKQTRDPTHVLKTSPLFSKKGDFDYLWAPQKGQAQLGPNENYRLVPQIVWEMEAGNSSWTKNLKTKTILLKDGFQWWNKPGFVNDLKELTPADCEIAPNSLTKCVFTEDHGDEDINAVIAVRDWFHTDSMDVKDDVWRLFFVLEAPYYSSATLDRDRDLLATYWRGSDIVTPYDKWVYYDLNKKFKKTDRDYSKGKHAPVAAIISNCYPGNDRTGYIRELQKHIKVDVYGLCGQFKCERSGNGCFDLIKKKYFFYLSFENSNCRDYITEKLFKNGLKNDIVPIVMGAHPDDYKALAPHRSYIHIEDFNSPKALASHLKFLMTHPSQYNKYFEWKGTGEFVSAAFFCQVCAMVHYADFVPPPKRTQPFRWGRQEATTSGMCLPAAQWYWTKNNNGTKETKTKEKDVEYQALDYNNEGGLI